MKEVVNEGRESSKAFIVDRIDWSNLFADEFSLSICLNIADI